MNSALFRGAILVQIIDLCDGWFKDGILQNVLSYMLSAIAIVQKFVDNKVFNHNIALRKMENLHNFNEVDNHAVMGLYNIV